MKELEQLTKQETAEITKWQTLKDMLSEDLLRDVEKDPTLTKFDAAKKYVLSQLPLRKEWSKPGVGKKKNADDMDIGAAENADGDVEEPPSSGAGAARCARPRRGVSG